MFQPASVESKPGGMTLPEVSVSRPTLCIPMDGSPPGSPVHGILQAVGELPWSGLPCPSPGDFPDPGIEPESPTLQADSLLCESPGKVQLMVWQYLIII